jgi:hypothetical protein
MDCAETAPVQAIIDRMFGYARPEELRSCDDAVLSRSEIKDRRLDAHGRLPPSSR